MKEARLINRFSEKIFIWGNGPFYAQKLHILITLVPLEESFLNFAQWKGPIGRWNDNNNFPKNFFWRKWTILGPKMAYRHNSASAVRIFLNVAQ